MYAPHRMLGNCTETNEPCVYQVTLHHEADGWIMCSTEAGRKGLVPAAYIRVTKSKPRDDPFASTDDAFGADDPFAGACGACRVAPHDVAVAMTGRTLVVFAKLGEAGAFAVVDDSCCFHAQCLSLRGTQGHLGVRHRPMIHSMTPLRHSHKGVAKPQLIRSQVRQGLCRAASMPNWRSALDLHGGTYGHVVLIRGGAHCRAP